jgi:hypothetical protein
MTTACCAALALAATAAAGAPVPEKSPRVEPERLLSATSQFYLRWDGFSPHKDAYARSAFGQLLTGPSGEAVREFVRDYPNGLNQSITGEQLLQGADREKLARLRADIKQLERLPKILLDHGILIGGEVRDPAVLDPGGLIGKFGDLIGGKPASPVDLLLPEVRATVIVPDAAADAKVLFAAMRVALRGAGTITEEKIAGRTVHRFTPAPPAPPVNVSGTAVDSPVPIDPEGKPDATPLAPVPPPRGVDLGPGKDSVPKPPAKKAPPVEKDSKVDESAPETPVPNDPVPPVPPAPPQPAEGPRPEIAWWVEGDHFVLVAGTESVHRAVARIAKPGDGLLRNPLYKQVAAFKEFETSFRGFADVAAVRGLVTRLSLPFMPDLSAKLESIGLNGLKSVVGYAGFDGEQSRFCLEMDWSGGARRGLSTVGGAKPLALADLPPLPADVSRFTAVRLDPAAIYEVALTLYDLAYPSAAEDSAEAVGVALKAPKGEPALKAAEVARRRRDVLAKSLDQMLGFGIKDDLLPALGDVVATYQSPREGVFNFNQVVCVSVKDRAAAERMGAQVARAFERAVGSPVSVRRKQHHGVEVRQLSVRNLGFVTPTYAVTDGWAVLALYPQPVQGFVARSKGKLSAWKPDERTAATFARLPKTATALQYSDPRAALEQVLAVAPIFLGTVQQNLAAFSEGKDPKVLDVGLIPNAHEVSERLFPNVACWSDDGRVTRWQTFDSLALPTDEVFGPEFLVFFAGFAI